MPEDERAEDEIFEPGLGRAHGVALEGWRRRRAPGSAARGRDRARSGRWPRSSSSCRWSRAAPAPGTRSARCRSRSLKRSDMMIDSAEPISTSDLHEDGEAVGDEEAVEATWRSKPSVGDERRWRRRSTTTASHDDARAPSSSPRKTPMHQQQPWRRAARKISGSAGRKLGSARWHGRGPSAAPAVAAASWATRDVRRRSMRFADRGLHRPQEGGRIDAHPQHDGDQRREDQRSRAGRDRAWRATSSRVIVPKTTRR